VMPNSGGRPGSFDFGFSILDFRLSTLFNPKSKTPNLKSNYSCGTAPD
jgi:hypothetical protein